jgi:hypothetical protein
MSLRKTGLYFELDGFSPPHNIFSAVLDYINRSYPNRWIARGGSHAWSTRSFDFNHPDYYLSGLMKKGLSAHKNQRQKCTPSK